MIPYSGMPFLRFIIAFISGIFFYLIIQPARDYLIFSLIFLVLYLLLFYIQKQKKELVHTLSSYLGIIALVILFFAGNSFAYWNDEFNNSNHLLNQSQKGRAYEAIVLSNPEEKANSYKVLLKIEKLFYKDSTKYTASQAYLYFSKKNFDKEQVTYGDRIIITGWPEEIKGPVNPFEFDYKQYSKFLHVYHQHFVEKSNFQVIEKNQGNPIITFAFMLRTEADKIIRHFVNGKDEQNIASALLLGLKNTLSQDIKEIYSITGTTHVLAVSGMHVTVLCQLLMSLFLLVRSARFKNFILPLIMLTALWVYVLVTGFSPSVLRSGVMFSLIIVGNILRKSNTNIYNSVLVSAFVLLCYDPFMLMDVGFQLSYLAVIGLLFFTDRIYKLKEVENRILDAVWKLLAVSIAAQIITLPLCVFYFHQIPVSALLSNLIAVPISTVLLYLGIILLISSFVPLLPDIIGYFFGRLIWLMNSVLDLISSFEFSTIAGVNLNLVQLMLIYGIILLVTAFIVRKHYSFFIASCILLLVFLITLSVQIVENKHQQRAIVYNIRNKKVIAFVQGRLASIVGDPISSEDFKFHIEPSMIAYGVKRINSGKPFLCSYSESEFDLFVFHQKSFLIINQSCFDKELPRADYILTHRKNEYKLNNESKLILCAGGNTVLKDDSVYDMNRNPALVMNIE